MKAATSAGSALAAVLLDLLDTIEQTAGVAVGNSDPDVLHDLRVAVRRSRSLLKYAGDLLPTDAAESLAWMAGLTAPVRDLDVFIDRLGQPTPVLEPFVRTLRAQRGQARRALRQGLRSERYWEFVTTWRSSLENVEPGSATVQTVASERLVAAYQRVVRKAKRASTPADLHQVRKRCKELRYLLEAFRPVCDRSAYQVIKRKLTALQDELGAVQDAQVRRAIIRSAASPELPPGTLVEMGVLIGADEAAAQSHRRAAVRRLRRFARPKLHRRVTHLIG